MPHSKKQHHTLDGVTPRCPKQMESRPRLARDIRQTSCKACLALDQKARALQVEVAQRKSTTSD